MKHMDIQANYQSLLLKLGLCVLKHKQKEARDIYQAIIPVVASMPNEEFAILTALLSRMLHHEARYQEANEILTMMPVENIDPLLVLCRDKWVLMHAIHMENNALFHILYPKYQSTLIRLGYYQEINKLRRLCIIYFADMMSVESYKQFLKNNHRMPKKFSEIARLLNLLHNKAYAVVISYIEGCKEPLSNDLMVMYLIALDGLNQSSKIHHVLDQICHLTLSENQQLIVQFIKIKSFNDKI